MLEVGVQRERKTWFAPGWLSAEMAPSASQHITALMVIFQLVATRTACCLPSPLAVGDRPPAGKAD
jgi:hypothetical protein